MVIVMVRHWILQLGVVCKNRKINWAKINWAKTVACKLGYHQTTCLISLARFFTDELIG